MSFNGGIFRVGDKVRLKLRKNIVGVVYDIQYCMVANIVYWELATGTSVSDYESDLEFDPLEQLSSI